LCNPQVEEEVVEVEEEVVGVEEVGEVRLQ
jgi:hypothetical protein